MGLPKIPGLDRLKGLSARIYHTSDSALSVIARNDQLDEKERACLKRAWQRGEFEDSDIYPAKIESLRRIESAILELLAAIDEANIQQETQRVRTSVTRRILKAAYQISGNIGAEQDVEETLGSREARRTAQRLLEKVRYMIDWAENRIPNFISKIS